MWHSRGLPPWPIATPGVASLQAALNPDTQDGYLYFLGKNDGSGDLVFARTYDEHLHNIQRLPGRLARAVSSAVVRRSTGHNPTGGDALIETLVPRSDPTPADYERWREADRLARPQRLAAFRARLQEEGVDAYFGVRRENIRYLTGLELGDGEEKVAGYSGQFLVVGERSGRPGRLALHGPGPRAVRRTRASSASTATSSAAGRSCWRASVAASGWRSRPASSATRCGRSSPPRRRTWSSSRPRAGSRPLRQVKEPAELERVAAACAVADRGARAAAAGDPAGRHRGGARARARVGDAHARRRGARLRRRRAWPGPSAALPHGSPGPRRSRQARCCCSTSAPRSCGYRSDMTRTLFVGEPPTRDLEIYELVARAQQAAIDALAHAIAEGEPLPSGHVDRTSSRATSSRRPATATISATAWATASASRRTSCRRSG